VHHADDFDAVGQWHIKNDLTSDRETAQGFSQFGTFPSRQRILDQHLKDLTDAVDLPLGGAGIVNRNKIPDRIEIDVGLGRFANSIRHVFEQPVFAVPAA
jgi:hypothetical protein